MGLRRGLSPVSAYVMSVTLEKGFSLISIPLVARYLSPQDYGRLEVTAGIIEFVGLLLTFGAADTLVRFASVASTESERKATAAQVFGTSLVLVLVLGAVVQLAAPILTAVAGNKVSDTAFRMGLLAATVTALIEMPLVWLRLNERTNAFLGFIAVRSCIQLFAMWVALSAGSGADGVLIASSLAVLVFATLLTAKQIGETGAVIGSSSLKVLLRYGLPLVGAALAMFALGSMSRLFLAWHVTDAEIAYFGLALKLALIAPLLQQPFALWWNPRRIEVLRGPMGLQRSAEVWGLGLAVLVFGAMGVALGAPILIYLGLPKSYEAAAVYVAPLVLVCVFNELCTLCNVGAYSRNHGGAVLAVNVVGALVGIAGYMMFAARFGVYGVIIAMALGQLTRLALFLWIGHRDAPIRYPFAAGFLLGVTAIFAVVAAPDGIVYRLIWSGGACVLVAMLALQVGFVRLPEFSGRLAKRRALAGSR